MMASLDGRVSGRYFIGEEKQCVLGRAVGDGFEIYVDRD